VNPLVGVLLLWVAADLLVVLLAIIGGRNR
jgi:hypothetical protein